MKNHGVYEDCGCKACEQERRGEALAQRGSKLVSGISVSRMRAKVKGWRSKGAAPLWFTNRMMELIDEIERLRGLLEDRQQKAVIFRGAEGVRTDKSPLFLQMAIAHYVTPVPSCHFTSATWNSPAGREVRDRLQEEGLITPSGTPTEKLTVYIRHLCDQPLPVSETRFVIPKTEGEAA